MPGTQRDRLDRVAVSMLVVFCAIWGVQQIVIKLTLPAISPVMQAAIRSIGATLLVFAWSRARGIDLRLTDGTLPAGLLAGALFAGEFALLFWALEYTLASRGVIFLYTAPFIVALGATWLLPHERLRTVQWAGLALAFSGILVLFGENLLRPGGKAWIGDLMMLGAAVLWAATTLTVKVSCLGRAAPEKTLLYQLAVSAAVLPLVSAALGEAGVRHMDLRTALLIGFQIVVVASFSYLGWFWLIRRYPATRLSAFSFLTPVMGVLAGALLLGEPLTRGVIAALALVVAGIWLANRPPKAA